MYTQEEISSYIEIYQRQLDKLLLDRKELNKVIANAKKQKQYWEELDERQTRIF